VRFVLFLCIFLANQVLLANYLSCQEQQVDPTETKCGEIYNALLLEFEKNKQFNVDKEWKKYKSECSETGEYEIYLADRLQGHGQHEEGEKVLRKIIKEKGATHDMRLAYAILMQSLSSRFILDDLKQVSLECVLRYPYWYRGYLIYGEALVYEGDYLEAKKYIEKAISMEDRYAEAYALLTIIYRLEFRDHAMAVKMYKKAISFQQNSTLFAISNTTLEGVGAAMMQDEYKLAAWILEKQVELYPEANQKEWYKDLKTRVWSYFKEDNIQDPFTPEERKSLADGADPLDIIGRD
jgi:tetratricopeptide (TPR) repeat protein